MFLLKRLSPHTLFSRTSPYSIFTALCSTSSPSQVSVWWDLENCGVPSGVSVCRGAQAITAAIESSGIKGPIQIRAFGDMSRVARTNQEAFSSTAFNSTMVDLNYTPYEGEEEEDVGGNGSTVNRFMLTNAMHWTFKNPPPANLFFITDDGFSSCLLHQLRMDNYNIFLASKESVRPVLKSSATRWWNWDVLVRGENLTGRLYNQPPEESWYGQYEGPIEDPFTEIEGPAFAPDDQLGEVLQQKHSKSKTHDVFSQNSE